MTDVSAWDPVDDNNNAAPPAGWPEGMMPSGVNNSARAMMGALRREHDRIVGQIGGTAGAITVPTLNATTVNATDVNATNATLSGAISAPFMHSTGDVHADNAVVTQTLVVSGAATVGGALTAAQLTSTGNINATADIGGRGVYVQTVNATGAVTAAQLTSTGNASVAGTLTSGAINASSQVACPTVNCSGTVAAHDITVAGNEQINGNLYVNAAFGCWFGVAYRGINPSYAIGFNYTGNLDLWVNDGYAFSIVPSSSDARLKTNIAPSHIDALGVINQMTLSAYDRDDRPDRRFSLGLVAQDVEALIPEAVVAGPEAGEHVKMPNLLHLDYNPLLAYTIRALQQMAERVEQLTERIDQLERPII